ncbi:MAG: HU family DNA-binding protein [Deinococcaceae bacterium]
MAKQTAAKPAVKASSKTAVKTATKTASSNKIAKTQLVDLVAGKTSLNKKESGEAISALLESIIVALREGQSVGLPGLGTFSVSHTAERQGVRPGTNERITIPAGKKIRFKVATTLKGSL